VIEQKLHEQRDADKNEDGNGQPDRFAAGELLAKELGLENATIDSGRSVMIFVPTNASRPPRIRLAVPSVTINAGSRKK
jgi:hypothetical protein